MVDVPLEKVTNDSIANTYKAATEIFRKQLNPSFYEKLQQQGTEMLENGIELTMEQLKFYGCIMQDRVQIWVETRKHKENYESKHAEFEKAVNEYFA